MTIYSKTTLLLLFLLCVTKQIQAKYVESADKLESSHDSEAVTQKANISESSTLGSLGKGTDVDRTTEDSAKEKDEIGTVGENKGNHALRRKRRSQDEAESDDKDSATAGSESTDNGNDLNMLTTPLDLQQSSQADLSKTNNDKKRFFSYIINWIKKVFSRIFGLRRSEGVNPKFAYIFTDLMNLFHKHADTLGLPAHLQDKIKELQRSFDDTFSKTASGVPESDDSQSLRAEVPKRDEDKKKFLDTIWKCITKAFSLWSNHSEGITNADAKEAANFFTKLIDLFDTYADTLDIPAQLREEIKELKKSFDGTFSKTASGVPESDDSQSLRAEVSKADEDEEKIVDTTWNRIKKTFSWLFNHAESTTSFNTKEAAEFFTKLTDLFDTYADALGIPPHHQEEIRKLLKGFKENHSNEDSATKPALESEEDTDDPSTRSEDEPKPSHEIGSARSSEDEQPSLERILQRYCELKEKSSNIIMNLKRLVKEFDVDYKTDNNRRGNTDLKMFIETLWMINNKDGGSTKRSGYDANFIREVISKYCENSKRFNSDLSTKTTSTHARESVRPKVRTKSNKIHHVSEEERKKQNEYDDAIGWRHGVFEPDKDQSVSKKQTEKSSPRIIKKSKIRKLKKPKNLKSRLLNLYNGKENGTGTRDHTGQFSKPKIVGHKENSSTLFEVKTGVERETGSKDSNPRLRCNVKTKGSMSDADGRTGRSKGHTFSEVLSNDTKALLCSSETSEVHRPSKGVYIKQSVSGKSVVSYDNPDKYIGHNYSPSKENLEIGTSGFSTLNDTSSKNQSISVVSTDSQNADSVSRSETKFVNGKGNQKGMESSANVEGSIDAVPNKNPFIMNSKQHSLGTVVENPDKNMESPLPVEKNEKLQTYSKFERTEDFDINFRSLSEKPNLHRRRRPR